MVLFTVQFIMCGNCWVWYSFSGIRFLIGSIMTVIGVLGCERCGSHKGCIFVGAVEAGDTRRRTLGNGFLGHSESRIMQGFHRMYYY